VELVLATQCIVQTPFKNMEIRVDGSLPAGVTAKDLVLGVTPAGRDPSTLISIFLNGV
jgi:homoaconitase/3-isopropylmalate dehydratase large subunit